MENYLSKQTTLLGLGQSILAPNFLEFVTYIERGLRISDKATKRSVETLAFSLKIEDKTEIKELTELAIVNVAREIATGKGTVEEKYKRIVELYNNQMILSHRTSQSVLLQQYSTPAPIAYLMGVYCRLQDLHTQGGYAFEPSAGNGLLTIAAEPQRVYVNEIDATRNRNLHTQGFANVFNRDATNPMSYIDLKNTFQSVITNPPFGRLSKPVSFNDFKIVDLDHLMSLRALETMLPNGKAAIIIGGHTRWDKLGRIEKGKNRIFFNYLYHHYNVEDVIQIDGNRLYTRQGTGFPVRLILINGKKQEPNGAAPLKDNYNSKVIKSFDELFERVIGVTETQEINNQQGIMFDIKELEREAKELLDELNANTVGNIEEEEDDDLVDFNLLFKRYKELKPAYKDDLLLMETPSMFITYDEDAVLLAKSLRIGIIKAQSDGLNYTQAGISKILIGEYLPKLLEQGISFSIIPNGKKTNWKKLEDEVIQSIKYANGDFSDLGMPYKPASQACVVLDTQVPDSMGFETQAALAKVKSEIGGSMDNFVRHRLGYLSHNDLCKALSAEQIDAVAMSIYNIEARGQGMIIGDQTGIGKGRIAAAMIRYGVKQGMKPIFITEKANLFSDIYRDLSAIGSADLKPFIINGREPKTDIKDEDGNIVHQALAPSEQQTIFNTGKIPASYDFVVGTYSQFNSPEKKPEKPNYLLQISNGNMLIMDEAHNSSGSSNTGEFMQRVVSQTKGVVFLSATFAKRPDNMPIYAMKTSISEANMTKDELVEAINKGGVALQEILSSQLVAEGQMIRRERSFEGIEVNYISLDEYSEKHKKLADGVTSILRDIIGFQTNYVDKKVDELDEIAAKEGKEMELREGTSQAGVDNLPYFSKVFNVINQMLFSLKAEAVADRTIERLKEGKKPVIAFASTMGSFIEQMENDKGILVGDGDLIDTNFSMVLRKGLEGIMRYTEKDITGASVFKHFEVSDFDAEARNEYDRISKAIDDLSVGLSISPIDVIIQKLEKAGYRVAEVTGRKFSVQLNADGSKGLVNNRKKVNTNDAFRQFNNNEVDVLMINQSGSTGASAHAIVTAKVPKEEVRQRVMIVLQAELDINTEVQKRGRINRTGQILKPIYDYMISSIPAEKRLMMMLQKKLKSLDANTTSNQKQSTKILDVPDFLNKYGDKVVKEYLMENLEINKLLNDPLGLEKKGSESNEGLEDAAHKVSGRVAVLSTQQQAEFYNEITERYNDYVEYLKQIGEYDLEVEALDLKTETVEQSVIKMGKGGESAFGEDSILEKVKANVLKKPFSKTELNEMLSEALNGKYAEQHKRELLDDFTNTMEARLNDEMKASEEKYEKLIKEIPNEKKIQKLVGTGGYDQAVREREKELKEGHKLNVASLQKSYKYKQEYLQRILNFFTIGRKLAYPVFTFDNGQETILAVCLGIHIDRKKKNPYAPSAIKVKVAIANSSKFIAIPASFNEGISKIITASMDIKEPKLEDFLMEWDEEIKQRTKDRSFRYIITGNLLQAFGSDSGKLVSYTTMEGQTKKGILMPEEWQPKTGADLKITVPIIKALPILQSLTNGSALYASNEIAFFNTGNKYRVIVPLSRSRGGDIYTDRDLMALVDKGLFEKASDKMAAYLPKENVVAFATILQNKFGVSVSIQPNQLSLVKTDTVKISNRKSILLPPNEDEAEIERIRILELEAEALLIEMEMAA